MAKRDENAWRKRIGFKGGVVGGGVFIICCSFFLFHEQPVNPTLIRRGSAQV
jgi:hypothetical protein